MDLRFLFLTIGHWPLVTREVPRQGQQFVCSV